MSGSKRLSQAISEGDGISFIASVDGPDAAQAAERDGAKAVLVHSGDETKLEAVATAVRLPVVFFFDGQQVDAIRGADACVVEGDLALLERWHLSLADDFELAIRVEEEDRLEEVLERFDPEILVLASGGGNDRLGQVLALLSDVPAGKLAIAELDDVDQGAIDELERAGCDAVLFGAPAATG